MFCALIFIPLGLANLLMLCVELLLGGGVALRPDQFIAPAVAVSSAKASSGAVRVVCRLVTNFIINLYIIPHNVTADMITFYIVFLLISFVNFPCLDGAV